MDIGTLLSVTQTLLAALQCSQLKELWSIWGYKSDLDKLSSVVATVKKVLLDAEAKYGELSQETLLYIGELKDALYDADDLLDEFVTLAKQKQLMEDDDKFIRKVGNFFSRYNQLGVAYNMSRGVKKIMKKLDGIASKHSKFGLSLDHKPIRRMREETCSYADTEIIGRAEDVEKIVNIVLDSDVERDVSFLTIVGMGGLGKTALAQLVYNHEKIVKEYPLRLWTCVSDHDQSKLDVKTILTWVLESATQEKYEGCSLEVVVDQLRKVLVGKRFFIVFDDLWTESRDEWRKLVGHLVGGEEGSQVVVTTRSKETAKIVGSGLMYELKGLSVENSWHLFQLMAFDQVIDQGGPDRYDDFINIGKEIVKICVNVPLAIRVIGRLLYGQEKSKWLSIQELGLANLREGQNGIKPILKLSYHNLESPLKSCFSYCSIYPKDFIIQKEMLISLWIAQGYIVPLEKGQSIEDASEEYFLILLRRCFFQDVTRNGFGEISVFKLHDLMYDVALEVAEKEICPASSLTDDINEAVRHVSLVGKPYADYCSTKAKIRTLLHIRLCKRDVVPIDIVLLLENFRCLRTLDLSSLNVKTLPASIGKLIHLRYLNLSKNRFMEVLPVSITRLYNLQTLNLDHCQRLKELPKDFSKLVNLRVLGLHGCRRLAFMPSGMGNLTGLYKLSKFVVGEGNSSMKQHVELEGLKALKKLRGYIWIVIHFAKSDAFVKDSAEREGAYVRDKELLNTIRFECKHKESSSQASDYEEELLGALQPHANLKVLDLVGYRGLRMPRWAAEENLACFLPNLIRLDLQNCFGLQCLPSLGKLRHLESLRLSGLPNLEYIESHPTAGSLLMSCGEGFQFSPCIKRLTLTRLPRLKEWWGASGDIVGEGSRNSSTKPHRQSFLSLSHLEFLGIQDCPNLTLLPHCPKLTSLHLSKFNDRLRMLSAPISPKLNLVSVDNMAWLHYSLPAESLQSLTSLVLYDDSEVESLTGFVQVFRTCSSSLQTLEISRCSKLRSISGGLGCLAALETLVLSLLPIVDLADEKTPIKDEDVRMPWGSLCHTLQRLHIYNCKEMLTFPKWMQKFTSLRQLDVRNCSKELYERCQGPAGEAWPNIRHIDYKSILITKRWRATAV